MATFQYDADINAILGSLDGDDDNAGISLAQLAGSNGFYIDNAPATEQEEAGPDTLCVTAADTAPEIILQGETTAVPVSEFVGHPIRLPH